MLAREDLGRGHQRGLAAGLDGGEHGEERDEGLAGADVALEQAVHPLPGGHVGGDLGDAALLRGGEPVRQCGDDPGAQPAVAAGGDAPGAFHPGAGDGEGQRVGEQLVVGEALAGRGRGHEIGRAGGGMGGGEGGVPVGPAPLALQARFDPFGQRPDALEGGLHGAVHRLEGEALSQRIDRLEGRERLGLAGAQDVVGVDHLGDAVEQLDAAGDDAPLAARERRAQPVGAGVEEHELELGQRVADVDAIGAGAGGAGLVQADLDLDGDGLGEVGAADRGAQGAVDAAGRQGKEQIDRVGDLEPGEQLLGLRADPVERGELGEEREEDVRAAHRGGAELACASAASRRASASGGQWTERR